MGRYWTNQQLNQISFTFCDWFKKLMKDYFMMHIYLLKSVKNILKIFIY